MSMEKQHLSQTDRLQIDNSLWSTAPRLPTDVRYIPVSVRREVMERDKGMCRYCGVTAATDCDHVYPWSNGGTNHVTNLVASCEECNSIAGLRIFSEFMKKKAYILARRAQIRAK